MICSLPTTLFTVLGITNKVVSCQPKYSVIRGLLAHMKLGTSTHLQRQKCRFSFLLPRHIAGQNRTITIFEDIFVSWYLEIYLADLCEVSCVLWLSLFNWSAILIRTPKARITLWNELIGEGLGTWHYYPRPRDTYVTIWHSFSSILPESLPNRVAFRMSQSQDKWRWSYFNYRFRSQQRAGPV